MKIVIFVFMKKMKNQTGFYEKTTSFGEVSGMLSRENYVQN